MSENAIITTAPSAWLDHATISAVIADVAINQPLAELVNATIQAAAGDSEHTARAYQHGIGLFLQFLSERHSDRLPTDWQPLALATTEGRRTVWEFRGYAAVLRLVSAALVDEFAGWLQRDGELSRATVNQRLNAARALLRVAMRDNVLTFEQGLALGIRPYRRRQRRDVKPVGRRLAPAEVRQLRAIVELKARHDMKAIRDRAILDVALFAGLRREEIARLSTENFKQDGGRWWIVLRGKGGKTRRLKLHDVLFKSLTVWIDAVGLEIGKGNDPVFYNLTKGGQLTWRRLNSSVIGRIVAEYGHLAGLAPADGNNRISPHDLRRTCARNAYDNGASLMLVQAMLGHSDPKTTAHYIGANETDDDTGTDYVRY
ncbi:MAG: site-specific integrase [Chloroflexi bacterium]|jgi:integrase/recombinase XerD|nr:site-specific integrase [Chloroflexota bacterium]